MTKKFSVLLNSRHRPLFLFESVSALNELAAKPSQIEIFIGVDDDDTESIEAAESLAAQYLNVRVFVEPRMKNLHRFINKLAQETTGEYLWVINDDAQILDLDWDVKIDKAAKETLSAVKDGIGYFSLPTNSADKIGDYAEFPLITREAYKALGFFEFDGTDSWGADLILHKIYNSVNRVFKLNCLDYPIRHIYHEKGTTPNKTRADMEKVFLAEFAGGKEDWQLAMANFRKYVDNIDVTTYSNKLKEKISG